MPYTILFPCLSKGIPTAKSTRPRRRRAFRCPKCEDNQTFYQPRELTHPTLGKEKKTSSSTLGRGYVSISGYIRVYQGISKLFQNIGSVFWNVWDNFPDLSNTFFLKISNHIYQTSLRSLMWKHQKLRTITIDLYRNLCRGLGLHKSWGTPISICSEYLGLWKKRRLDTQAMSESPSVQMFTPPPCRFPDHNVVTSPGVASSGRGCSTKFWFGVSSLSDDLSWELACWNDNPTSWQFVVPSNTMPHSSHIHRVGPTENHGRLKICLSWCSLGYSIYSEQLNNDQFVVSMNIYRKALLDLFVELEWYIARIGSISESTCDGTNVEPFHRFWESQRLQQGIATSVKNEQLSFPWKKNMLRA